MDGHNHSELLQLSDSRILSAIAAHLTALSTNRNGTLDVAALFPLSVTCSQFLDHLRPHYMATVVVSDSHPPTALLDMLGQDFSCLVHVREIIVNGLSDLSEWQALRRLCDHLPPALIVAFQDLPLHQGLPPGFKKLCALATALRFERCRVNKQAVRFVVTLDMQELSFVGCDFTSGICHWGVSFELPSLTKLCLLPNAAGEQALYNKLHLSALSTSLKEVVLSLDWSGLPDWLLASEHTLTTATAIIRGKHAYPTSELHLTGHRHAHRPTATVCYVHHVDPSHIVHPTLQSP